MKGLFMIKKFGSPYTPNTVKLGTVHLEPAEVTAIALLINPWSAAHPDTPVEEKVNMLRRVAIAVLHSTRDPNINYV
jgi:hypothetical protein